MKNKATFFSTEIKANRIMKMFLIALPLAIMISFIGDYIINTVDNFLRMHYLSEYNEKVLGSKQSKFEIVYKGEIEEITKNYGIDEYMYNWSGEIDNFLVQNSYIREPIFYLGDQTAKTYQKWHLKNGYDFELNCPPIELDKVIPGDYYSCSVKYNGTPLSDSVRYFISSSDSKKTQEGIVSLIVYSPNSYEINTGEFVILGSYAGGSYDDILVFKLVDGIPIQLKFNYQEEIRDNWSVSNPLSLRLLYADSGEIRLVTHHHNPATGPINVYRIWSLDSETFTLYKSIGDISGF